MALLVLSSCKDHPADRDPTALQFQVDGYCHLLVLDLEQSARTYREFVDAGAGMETPEAREMSISSIGVDSVTRSLKIRDIHRRLLFCMSVRGNAVGGVRDELYGTAVKNIRLLRLSSHDESIALLEELTERTRQIVALPLLE
ncbi:MAG: hypothetical protein ACTHU0_05200 [Kofleriaceae bacterium]